VIATLYRTVGLTPIRLLALRRSDFFFGFVLTFRESSPPPRDHEQYSYRPFVLVYGTVLVLYCTVLHASQVSPGSDAWRGYGRGPVRVYVTEEPCYELYESSNSNHQSGKRPNEKNQ
jgi:hypothetical protein